MLQVVLIWCNLMPWAYLISVTMCKALLSEIEAHKVIKFVILSILHASIFLEFSIFQASIGISSASIVIHTASIVIHTASICYFEWKLTSMKSRLTPFECWLTRCEWRLTRMKCQLTPGKCQILRKLTRAKWSVLRAFLLCEPLSRLGGLYT